MPRGTPNNPKTAKKRGRKATSAKKAAPAKPQLQEFYLVVGNDCSNQESFHIASDERRAKASKLTAPSAEYLRIESADIAGPVFATTKEEAFKHFEDEYSFNGDNVLTLVNMTAGTVSKHKITTAVVITDV